MIFAPLSAGHYEPLFDAALLTPGGEVAIPQGVPVYNDLRRAESAAQPNERIYGVRADWNADTVAQDMELTRLLARDLPGARLMGYGERLLYRLNDFESNGGGPVGWMHWCMGCCRPHGIWVEKANQGGCRWVFDGNEESPTFSPSILIYGCKEDPGSPRCHYFIRGGLQQFCHDCEHAMAGKTVPLVLH